MRTTGGDWPQGAGESQEQTSNVGAEALKRLMKTSHRMYRFFVHQEVCNSICSRHNPISNPVKPQLSNYLFPSL